MDKIHLHLDNSTIVWQCDSGNTGEGIDYSDLCLQHDVIMIGPGNGGQYPGCLTSPVFEAACRENGERVDSARRYVRRIAEEMADGEIVVLKRGLSVVRGVGVVVGDYLYYPNFRDIRGWNVCHCRRVRWFWEEGHIFNSHPLAQNRLSKLWVEEVRNWLRTISYRESDMTRPLRPLP